MIILKDPKGISLDKLNPYKDFLIFIEQCKDSK